MSDQAFFADFDNVYIFKFVGNFLFSLCPAVEGFMNTLFTERGMRPVVVDMTETARVDSTALGILARMAIHCRRMLQVKPTVLVSNNDIVTILKGMSFDGVLNILQTTAILDGRFEEIKPVAADEKEMLDHILESHRTLMSMSPSNRAKFEQAIKVLEQQRAAKYTGPPVAAGEAGSAY